MSVSKILSSIVTSLTNREVKKDSAVTPKVISYSGQYYNGSDVVYVAGNSSSELVNNALVSLSEMYHDVVPTYPSKNDGDWDPDMADLAKAGKSTLNYVNPELV